MIPAPAANDRANPYRGLSVQEVDVPLRADVLQEWLLGREVYRRTDYLALRNGDNTALVAVRKASTDPLMSPVTEARILAEPAEVVAVTEPDADVGNATALTEAAARHHRPGARAYVVEGRYQHVNFIWDPSPVRIRVLEVVPPEPAKLLEQARQVVAFDEDLPPIELVLDAVRIPELAAAHAVDRYLLPCRGSGVDLDGSVAFLDTRPAERDDWLLIGCERSLQFHEHFYGDRPPQVDLCPRNRALAAADSQALALTKCCLWERGIDHAAGIATVPWGANLDEIRAALRLLTGIPAKVEA